MYTYMDVPVCLGS